MSGKGKNGCEMSMSSLLEDTEQPQASSHKTGSHYLAQLLELTHNKVDSLNLSQSDKHLNQIFTEWTEGDPDRLKAFYRDVHQASPFQDFWGSRQAPEIEGLEEMNREQTMQLLKELRDDENISPEDYRRIIRQTGYRGMSFSAADSPEISAVLGGHEDTFATGVVRDANGQPLTDEQGREIISEERSRLYDEIVAKYMQGATQRSERPRILVMAGGPGSGKSTVRSLCGLEPEGALVINPDDVIMDLPHYDQLVATGDPGAIGAPVYREKKEIQRRLLDAAKEAGVDMVLDITGNQAPGQFASDLRELRDAGYEIDLVYVDTDLPESMNRATQRGRVDGRMMTDEILASSHCSVAARFDEIRELDFIDNLRVYDNNGTEPRLIASRERGQEELTVQDQARMDSWQEKAQYEDNVAGILGYNETELGRPASRFSWKAFSSKGGDDQAAGKAYSFDDMAERLYQALSTQPA